MVSHKAAQRPYAPLWTASSHGFELCFGQRADETQHKSTLMLLRKREDEINVLRADLERAQAELHRRSAVRLCMLHQSMVGDGDLFTGVRRARQVVQRASDAEAGSQSAQGNGIPRCSFISCRRPPNSCLLFVPRACIVSLYVCRCQMDHYQLQPLFSVTMHLLYGVMAGFL